MHVSQGYRCWAGASCEEGLRTHERLGHAEGNVQGGPLLYRYLQKGCKGPAPACRGARVVAMRLAGKGRLGKGEAHVPWVVCPGASGSRGKGGLRHAARSACAACLGRPTPPCSLTSYLWCSTDEALVYDVCMVSLGLRCLHGESTFSQTCWQRSHAAVGCSGEHSGAPRLRGR